MALEPGALVNSNVRLVSRLGDGGMGSVWIADHLALSTRVAVKFLARQIADDAEGRARFSREASAAAQVRSPHVVQMLDYGVTSDNEPYLVMELLEGSDLSRYMAKRGRLDLREAAAIIGQVCQALSRAHERNIVHRDIKPENIFLCDVGTEEPFVKLLDFGIARTPKAPETATRSGILLGTPYYMSPEQMLDAKSVDHRTDLWSLGVVAFEAVVGRRPFDGDSVSGVTLAIAAHPLPVPSSLRPDLPAAFDAWFAKACVRDRNSRFPSARAMAEAIETVAGTRGPATPTLVSSPEPGAVPISRSARGSWFASTASRLPFAGSRLGGAMIALVLCVAAAVTGGVAMRRGRGQEAGQGGSAPMITAATPQSNSAVPLWDAASPAAPLVSASAWSEGLGPGLPSAEPEPPSSPASSVRVGASSSRGSGVASKPAFGVPESAASKRRTAPSEKPAPPRQSTVGPPSGTASSIGSTSSAYDEDIK